MALPSGSDLEIIGSGNSAGQSLGGSTSDLVSFYGVSPAVAQQSVTAIGTTTISQVGTTGKWAFATSTAALAFVARVRSIQDALDALGLVVEA